MDSEHDNQLVDNLLPNITTQQESTNTMPSTQNIVQKITDCCAIEDIAEPSNTPSAEADKLLILRQFAMRHKDAPVQQSAEWHASRANTIGGSEVSTILGKNPYRSVEYFVLEKTGIIDDSFRGNPATRWGTIFEEVTEHYIATLLNCKIEKFGSIDGAVPNQRYSPDGVAVVDIDGTKHIVLFEFKAPYKSIPDEKIPKHYIPQLQTGLLTIPIADFAIFVNNCYRKCRVKDIGYTLTYDKSFHSGDVTKKLTKKQKITDVYACGALLFSFASDKVPMDPIGMRLFYSNALDLFDFGEEPEETMDYLFELVNRGLVKVQYSSICINQNAVADLPFYRDRELSKHINYPLSKEARKIVVDEINQWVNTEDEFERLGYMCYKLVKSDIIIEHAVTNWINILRPAVEQTISNINHIRNSNDKLETFVSIYGDEKIRNMRFMLDRYTPDNDIADMFDKS